MIKSIRALGRRYTSTLPLTNRQFLTAPPPESSRVTLSGWIKSVRKSKNVAFADLSDGTYGVPVSVVLAPEDAKSLLTGACIQVSGTVQRAPAKKNDNPANPVYEIAADKVNLLGPATKDYPLQKKFHTQEFLRTIPEYRWKTNTGAAVLRYRSQAITFFSNYFASNGFTQVSSPLITASDCEGGGEVFQLSGGKEGPLFFGQDKKAYLSVSSQLHLEVFAGALSRVWNIAPAFRAEDSDTNRHLSEFWIVEAEIAFVNEMAQVMDVVENMVRSAVTPLLDENNVEGQLCARDLLAVKRDPDAKEALRERWEIVAGSPEAWPRVSYTEALDILAKEYARDPTCFGGPANAPPQWGDSIASVHEKYLASVYFKRPVFVTDYPVDQKPFYMLLNEPEAGRQTVKCFDLLIPDIGELVGGSMRENDLERLKLAMERKGMDPADLEWYVKLREHGSFPHGGYGMGFERFLAFVTGQENVREVIGFPRWAGSCVC
ncbi:uncharacterized protein SAPINGB_P005711 [Magnusiomyces paraingens]|uniref:asparagine--tRNA ligase n=1 Tax=Magnusiomyces paraingens TaxID=2606893 RepID=A0A5E8C0R9_9ASCO|nr:uncharacterized protein SAPINGB_P005711 [Saprochaete ingens]VVT57469.1 unnamed protein product [Saprochaete ingens]